MKYTLPPVVLEPSGTAVININKALADQGIVPYATLSGYVQLDYTWPWDPICATVHNIDPTHSLLFNYNVPLPTQPPADGADAPSAAPTTSVLEGMWWKQESRVTGFVALSNPTQQPITATLLLTDAQGNPIGRRSVTISSHGTKNVDLVELQQAATTSGGLRITYAGPQDGLLANGGLQDKAVGYSANLLVGPLAPTMEVQSPLIISELGLMAGAADPMLQFPAGTTFTPYSVMRNVSGQPATVTPIFYWMAGGAAQSRQLASFAVAPNQTLSLDVMGLLAEAGLKNLNGSFNLIFEVQAQTAHPLVMAAGSVDQKNTYVFSVTPSEVKERSGRALSYWSTGDGDDTMITLWNAADEAQDLAFERSSVRRSIRTRRLKTQASPPLLTTPQLRHSRIRIPSPATLPAKCTTSTLPLSTAPKTATPTVSGSTSIRMRRCRAGRGYLRTITFTCAFPARTRHQGISGSAT